MKKLLFASAFILFGLSAAYAQYDNRYDNSRYSRQNNSRNIDHNTAEIEHLQREARQRIDAGMERRQITRREADRLMSDYRRIEGMQRNYSNRGRLSNKETRILKDQLSRLMADTRRMSSNQGNYRAEGRDNRRGY